MAIVVVKLHTLDSEDDNALLASKAINVPVRSGLLHASSNARHEIRRGPHKAAH